MKSTKKNDFLNDFRMMEITQTHIGGEYYRMLWKSGD